MSLCFWLLFLYSLLVYSVYLFFYLYVARSTLQGVRYLSVSFDPNNWSSISKIFNPAATSDDEKMQVFY